MQNHWGERAGKHTLHRKNKLNIVACCSVFAIFPSFIDFLTLRVFDIIQKILFVIIPEHFLRLGRCRDKHKESLNMKTFGTYSDFAEGCFSTSRIETDRQKGRTCGESIRCLGA